MWAVSVNIEYTRDEYTGSKGLPTFYLDETVQGIRDEAGAIEVATRIVDGTGYLQQNGAVLHIDVIRL